MSHLVLSSEDIEIECPEIYGISASIKAYRLAWSIDRLPLFKVRMLDDVENYNGDSVHQTYEITDLDHDATLLMIKNKGSKGFFYKKYKNFDYLLFSVSPTLSINNDTLTYVKQLEVVSLCTSLVPPSKPDDMNFIQLL